MFKGLWQRTKTVATTYTWTFVIVMVLNQLHFFGFCLNPICLIAAMLHVLGVFNCHAAQGQLGGVVVQTLLHPFQYVFVFPSTDAVVLAAGVFVFDDTVGAVA
ncbi:MAG: hypothetical protein ABJL99_27310 [Aliishimia sp.]